MFKVKVAAISAVVISGFMWQTDAATWRLNPDESAKADFTSIKAAMDDERVQPGDELLLDPGYYGSSTLTKENITVTGSGYFMSENFNWPDAAQAYVSYLKMAEGCTVQGVQLTEINVVSNSTVSRCSVWRICGVSQYTRYYNVTIEGNYLREAIRDIVLSNSTIRNNIIVSGSIWTSSSYYSFNCVVEYNTIKADKGYGLCIYSFSDSQIRNNILIGAEESDREPVIMVSSDRNVYYNNVLSIAPENANASYPNNYYVGATVENTFVDELIADRYFLRDDSPAKGKASDGGDCGAFGGPTPYVLSGIPQYTPHITQAVIPSKPTGGALKVQLKIAVQDE